jgi:hypothetical protein
VITTLRKATDAIAAEQHRLPRFRNPQGDITGFIGYSWR